MNTNKLTHNSLYCSYNNVLIHQLRQVSALTDPSAGSAQLCTTMLDLIIISTAPKHIIKQVKAVPLEAWSGPEGSRKLSFPDFVTTA